MATTANPTTSCVRVTSHRASPLPHSRTPHRLAFDRTPQPRQHKHQHNLTDGTVRVHEMSKSFLSRVRRARPHDSGVLPRLCLREVKGGTLVSKSQCTLFAIPLFPSLDSCTRMVDEAHLAFRGQSPRLPASSTFDPGRRPCRLESPDLENLSDCSYV